MNRVTGTIDNLQILRAFAAINVVIFHIIFISIYYKVVTFITIPLNNDFLALLCLVGSILCGVVLYRFFEKPLTLFVKSTF
jgi:peptidoglycan/LPS O-acetylase OafA/YrhL